MTCDAPPDRLSIEALCRRCREETARYRRGQSYDDRFCFDVFRRAVVERDDACWEQLNAIYREQVAAWCRRAGASQPTDVEELAVLAWEKFWASFTPQKLAASNGSAGVLRYLQMCAHSVVVDAHRG